jgi:hypothetical protein
MVQDIFVLRTLRRATSLEKDFSSVADDVRSVLTHVLVGDRLVNPELRRTVLEAALRLSQANNGLDTRLLAGLALTFGPTNRSSFSKLVQNALRSSPSLLRDLERDFVPLCEHVLDDITTSPSINEVGEEFADLATILHSLAQASAEVAAIFGHSKRLILSLCKAYNSALYDCGNPPSIHTKAQSLEAAHSSLESAYLRPLADTASESTIVKTSDVFQCLLDVPIPSHTSTSPTALVNLGLMSDLEHFYRISNRLSNHEDPRLEHIRSAVISGSSKGRTGTGLGMLASGKDRSKAKGRGRTFDSSLDMVGLESLYCVSAPLDEIVCSSKTTLTWRSRRFSMSCPTSHLPSFDVVLNTATSLVPLRKSFRPYWKTSCLQV